MSYPAKGAQVFEWQIASSRDCFVPLSENKTIDFTLIIIRVKLVCL